MKQAYKHRPNDFKRRILETKIPDRKLLLEREYFWLSMIKSHELSSKYYNLHNHHFGHWTTSEKDSRTVREKISASVKKSLEDPAVQSRKQLGYQARDTKSSDPAVRQKRRQTMNANGKNKGKITVKDTTGNIFHTTKDDPRWISGELVAASKGIKRRPISEQHRSAIRTVGNFAKLNSIKIMCPYCDREFNTGSYHRYHGDKCKARV